ncbi:unnamed protein product [Adineta steineri]|uniref:Uncharacterized protein n=1 Tax=Adineta steineri TaxID=433720 RepID=A0A819N821_9BILA|nr:unnamed protein product [Adineta steineri]CAF1046114.1 unnamed protein product [Adineta steineri]CAF3686747.1 unnamed protein product [Adineta steineri]CAF3994252.1 unnamed protein product [Adineta steineri]
MQAQGQTEQSDQSLVPLTSPSPVLQEPVEEQQPPEVQEPVEEQQLPQEHQPPQERQSLQGQLPQGQQPPPGQQPPQEQLLVEQCPICQQYITPNATRIACGACDSVYHKNELLDYVRQLNNVQQPLVCCVCPGDMSWVLELMAPPASPDDLGIQQTGLDININNF